MRRGPSRGPEPSRRLVLRLLAGAALLPGQALLSGSALPQEAPRDQGIGGTGARPTDGPSEEGDRGIGGTGVIGTIRRFGSIVVNDLRIAYPADVAVRIDGAPATAGDLRIGHVVRVVARPGAGGFSTRRIDVTSEVVGPVEAVSRAGITVLGQRIATAGVSDRWAVGAWVAVSGLRRPDGVVVASLIEPRPTGPARVAGPVRRDRDGHRVIGGLRLHGADALPVGLPATVAGEAAAGVLRVANAAVGLPFPAGLARVSIEAYVGRRRGRLTLGSGLDVAGSPGTGVPRRGSVRAVLTTQAGRDGRLTMEALRVEDRVAPAPNDAPRFERAPDRIDLRGLRGQGRDGVPGREGPAPGGTLGADPGGRPGLDTRTAPGGGFGAGWGNRGGGAGGFERPGGFGNPGGLGPGAPGGPGGFGGGRR